MADKKYRFHLVGLVHLPTSEEYISCAFTQKNVKMIRMLMDMGHEVYLYGAEGSDVEVTKFIRTHTLKDIRDTWGEGDNRFDIGYNWKQKQFKHDINLNRTELTQKFMEKVRLNLLAARKPDDFLLITQGAYQKSVAQNAGLYLTVESGIGYRGSFARFRSFESTYIQNFTYGSEHPRESINGKFYDRVMPNYFDEKDFPFKEKKGDYYLYMGRLIRRKGVEIALMASQAAGVKLKLAGQLDPEISLSEIAKYPNAEYIGFADKEVRGELMSNAIATYCPSLYLEPFCGVHAESMLCGTPVITTNFGAFTDYVVDGVNGFKCNTLQDFVDATHAVTLLDPKMVRQTAEQFTMSSVSKQYGKWFDDLYQLYLSAADPKQKGWSYLKPSSNDEINSII